MMNGRDSRREPIVIGSPKMEHDSDPMDSLAENCFNCLHSGDKEKFKKNLMALVQIAVMRSEGDD